MEQNEMDQFSLELRALIDKGGLTPKELIEQLCIRASTECAFVRLQQLKNPLLQKAVLMRYGFVTGKPLTEAEVGEALGLTERRVRQIVQKCRYGRHCKFTHLRRILAY